MGTQPVRSLPGGATGLAPPGELPEELLARADHVLPRLQAIGADRDQVRRRRVFAPAAKEVERDPAERPRRARQREEEVAQPRLPAAAATDAVGERGVGIRVLQRPEKR